MGTFWRTFFCAWEKDLNSFLVRTLLSTVRQSFLHVLILAYVFFIVHNVVVIIQFLHLIIHLCCDDYTRLSYESSWECYFFLCSCTIHAVDLCMWCRKWFWATIMPESIKILTRIWCFFCRSWDEYYESCKFLVGEFFHYDRIVFSCTVV